MKCVVSVNGILSTVQRTWICIIDVLFSLKVDTVGLQTCVSCREVIKWRSSRKTHVVSQDDRQQDTDCTQRENIGFYCHALECISWESTSHCLMTQDEIRTRSVFFETDSTTELLGICLPKRQYNCRVIFDESTETLSLARPWPIALLS